MDIFSNDLNSSMMYKGQHPEYVLIVSLESNHSEFDSFWENQSIMNLISSKTIVVRLYKDENANDIRLFEFTFHHSFIPSLYIFGSNQATISHSWSDHFPTIEEFTHYFEENTKIDNETDSNEQEESKAPSSQQHSSSNLMPPALVQQFHNEQSNEDNNSTVAANSNNESNILSSHTPLKPPTSNSNLIKRPTPRAQPHQKSALITSTVDRSNNKQEKTQRSNNTARISVQGLAKTVNKTFPSNSTIGDLRSWIHSEFGRDLDLIVVHTHMPLPTDSNVTFSQADLCPSAVIRERDGGEATLRNDEDLNIGINERNHELANMNNNINLSNIYEDENVVTNSPSSTNSSGSSFGANNARQLRTNNNINGESRNGFGQILQYLKLLLRLINPWADDENDTDCDLERNLWEFAPNPNYMNSMLNQMNQNARQNVPQEDSWHPTMY